jgi:fructokinase
MTECEVLALGSALVELTPTTAGLSVAQADSYTALPSGATANFCVALARLGIKVALATRVGDDELGHWLRGKLAGYGVDMTHARAVPGQQTPVSFCWMDQGGEKTFYFYRFPGFSDPLAAWDGEPVGDEVLSAARLFDFSEATVRAEPLRSVSLQTARRARELGVRVCYAVNYRAGSWREPLETVIAVQREALALADIALMNREEAALLTGCAAPSADDLRVLGPELIAVTAGVEGSWIITPAEEFHLPARPVPVHYDIGAGDTYHAGLLAGLLRGLTPAEAARFATGAAALRICRTADLSCLPTWEEVWEELDKPRVASTD